MIDFRRLGGRASFTFIRHGESEGNNGGVLQGRSDYPLSEAGRDQARRAAAWFAKNPPPVDRLLTSPLARAEETARILASELGLAGVEVLPELTEADTGIFTGLTRAQIRAEWPDAYARFLTDSWESVPGAERVADLLVRAEAVWDLLFRLSADGRRTILAVTHSGFLQWLIKSTLGHRRWMPLFPVANCGICRLSVDNGAGAESLYCEWTAVNLSPF